MLTCQVLLRYRLALGASVVVEHLRVPSLLVDGVTRASYTDREIETLGGRHSHIPDVVLPPAKRETVFR